MPSGPDSGRLWRIVPLLLLVPFISVIIVVVLSGVPDLQRSGDGALLEFSTRSTARLQTLTGPYSRFGFHHPGPAYFLARMPVYYLFGMRSSADYITVSLICIVCIWTAASLILRNTDQGGVILFSLLMSAYLWILKPDIWLSDWNPFVIILPVLVTFLALAAVSAGEYRFLVTAVLAGSFAVQTHIGCFPAIAAAFLYAFVRMAGSAKREPSRRAGRYILLGTIAGLIMWSPLVLAFLTPGGGGNTGDIVAFMTGTAPDITPGRALEVWIDASSRMEGYLLPRQALRTGGWFFMAKGVLVALRVALLAFCIGLLRRRGVGGFRRALCDMALLLHPVTLLSVLQLRGEAHSYLFLWFSSLGPISWSAILLALHHSPGQCAEKSIRLLEKAAATLLIVCFTVLSTRAIWHGRSSEPADPLCMRDPLAAGISEPVMDGMEDYGLRNWEIVPLDHQLWPVMASLLNTLDKHGYRVAPSDEFQFMTGFPSEEDALRLAIAPSDSGDLTGWQILYRDTAVTVGIMARPVTD